MKMTVKQQAALTDKIEKILRERNALQLRLSADASVNELNIVQISPELNRIHGKAIGKPMPTTISFAPKQAGSGDPSPTNIRPISGYEITGIGTVYGGELNIDDQKLIVTHDSYTLTGTETYVAWSGGYYTRVLTNKEADTTKICIADRASTGSRGDAVAGRVDLATYSSNIYTSTDFYNNVAAYIGAVIIYQVIDSRYVEYDLSLQQMIELLNQI